MRHLVSLAVLLGFVLAIGCSGNTTHPVDTNLPKTKPSPAKVEPPPSPPSK
jgi:hypothetical protein